MSDLIAQTFVTIDGVMEAPESWQAGLFDEAMGQPINASYESAEAVLLGRVTYQAFAGVWPSQDDPFARIINAKPKYVASKTLRSLEWNNSKLLEGDIEDAVADLKLKSRKHILIPGSAMLVDALTRRGLIDEYELYVHPVLVGKGKRLFTQGFPPTLFTLTSSRSFGTGVVLLNYRRKGPAKIS